MAKNNGMRSDMSPMIRSDKSSLGNMPKQSFVKEYPAQPGFFNGSYNDGLSGLDANTAKDSGKLKSQKQKDRY